MNKTIPKKQRMGFELRLNRSGQAGEENWQRVGFLFNSASEAHVYRLRNHPSVAKYTVMGVKVPAAPKVPERFLFLPETKKGANNASK